MNTIGIDDNLDRPRIRKLLIIGLIASILTGISDFLLGYGESTAVSGLAESLMANAINLSDEQLIVGGLLGAFGLFIEGLAFFAIYRLMTDAAPRYAHIYRSGILAYIWLAPIGCHMNVGVMNYAYRRLFVLDPGIASKAAGVMVYTFCVPLWVILILFWLPMIVAQFKAFSKGLTPYPKTARWFNLIVGMIPALILALLIGPKTALGGGIGTMFLSFGNAFTFGGLLATLPSEEEIRAFNDKLGNRRVVGSSPT